MIAIPMVLSLLSACTSKSSSKEEGIDSLEGISDTVKLDGDTIVVNGDTVISLHKDERASAENSRPKSNAYIVVDKPNLKLYVIEGSDTLFKGPICAGRIKGNKRAKDDRRTPEGNFKITHIHDASGWLYHADNGRWIPHVYGPWFLRLDAGGWQGIGIHGTSAPAQIGQRRSKGCIRMKNEDIRKVHDLAFVGMEVRILPDGPDIGGEPVKKSQAVPDTTINSTMETATTDVEESELTEPVGEPEENKDSPDVENPKPEQPAEPSKDPEPLKQPEPTKDEP